MAGSIGGVGSGYTSYVSGAHGQNQQQAGVKAQDGQQSRQSRVGADNTVSSSAKQSGVDTQEVLRTQRNDSAKAQSNPNQPRGSVIDIVV